MLVRFAPGVSPGQRAAVLRSHGVTVVDRVERTGFVVIDTGRRRPAAVLASLARSPLVAHAEPNAEVRATVTPSDTEWPVQSGNLRLVRLPQAWSVTKGSPQRTIAIVDTGVELDHPDLSARLAPGWDFVNSDAVPADDAGHGTAVASVAAAITDNGLGVAGAAWNARILPVKVLDEHGGGTMATVAQGITWAVDQGADVINLSLGGEEDSAVLRSAVSYAAAHDVVVVAAAGNSADTVPNYPAAIEEVIAVSAVGTNGYFAYFSSFGDWVDVAAPGMFVYGASPDWSYQSYQGTSVAAPLVAGAALLVRSQYPEMAAPDVGQRLLTSAQDRGRTGFDRYYGHGLLDAYAAVGGPQRDPAPVPRDALEPDGRPSRATRVDDHAVATIAPEGDSDWYRFWAPQGRRVEWVVNPNGSTWREPRIFDPVVDVYDPEGDKLATVDPATSVATGTVVAPVDGTYRLRVRNSRPTMSHSNYVVTVGREGPATTLPPSAEIGSSSAALRWVTTGDVTDDGRRDVLTAVAGSTPGLLVHKQRPDGSFGQAFIGDPTADTSQIVTADMDRDGKTDAVAVADTVKIYYQRHGRLQPPVVAGELDDVRGILVGQFTRDRRPDILVASYLPYLTLYRSTPGGYEMSKWYSKPIINMAAGQLGGTRAQEIVTAEAGSFVTHTLGDDGRWSRTRTAVAFGDVAASGPVTVGDVTGDGRGDVLLSTGFSTWSYTMTFVRTRAGAFTPPTVVAASGPSSAALVDVGGDGAPDVVGVRSGHGVWRIHRQLGGGRFALAEDIPHGLGLYGIAAFAAADFDGDDIPDFVTIGGDGANGSEVRLARSRER